MIPSLKKLHLMGENVRCNFFALKYLIIEQVDLLSNLVWNYWGNNILFRADSSSTIGTGHIMRDLVLAQQYPEANITFATQDLNGNINHKIIETGYNNDQKSNI